VFQVLIDCSYRGLDLRLRARKARHLFERACAMAAFFAALASCAGAQDSPTALPDPLPGVEASVQPQPPVTVEQLAERLSAMEQLNRKLAGQLDEANKAHRAQMNVLLQRIGELSDRVGVGSPLPAMNPIASESIPPAPDERTAPEDVAFPGDDPVPDYTEGQSPRSRLPLVIHIQTL
jgi:phosphate-selective porin OprO/OprP